MKELRKSFKGVANELRKRCGAWRQQQHENTYHNMTTYIYIYIYICVFFYPANYIYIYIYIYIYVCIYYNTVNTRRLNEAVKRERYTRLLKESWWSAAPAGGQVVKEL